LALALELAHDLGHGLVDALGLDRTLAQRDLHRAQQLVAIERHAAAVALDDHQLAQLHALECGKAEIAGQAHTAATDDGGILGRPRVLDLRIEAAAIRTAHGRPLLSRCHSEARERNDEELRWVPSDLSLDRSETDRRVSRPSRAPRLR